MQKHLKLLETLQEIDLKMDVRANERQGLLAEKGALEERLAEASRNLAVRQEEQAALSAEKEGIEETLATERENIVRSEARLTEIKTQKEYQAVLKEISSAKKVLGELEEQLLQMMTQIEECTKEISGIEGDLAELQKNVDVQSQEIAGKIAQLDSDLATRDVQRKEVVGSLPASLVNRYSMLRERRQGIAVVEAREGSCLGCNMNLPPQTYNTLYRGDELISCPHCQRVLYLRQEA